MAGNGFFELHFSVDGVNEINRKFATWGQSLSDLSPAWDAVGGILRLDFMQNMIGEGGFYGAWAPLAPSTIAEKEREGYGDMGTLWRTGRLGESLAIKGAAGNINIIQPMSATFGSEIPYAAFHQQGTRKMPARKIVGITWSSASRITRALADYVRNSARQAGLDAN